MKRYLVASVLAFAMIGCGNSSSGSITNNPVAKASLNGVAVDDLIVNGIVKAYPANNKTNILATGRTDANNGSYTLDVTHDGVVVVEVTCDSTSLMKNPADNTTKPCISGLVLHSATAITADSGSVKVNISPLSELVVRQMKEKGTSADDLETAQNSIGLMFGVDPVAADPVNDTKLSSIIGAIHDMTGSGETILDVIDDINEDLKDGEAGDDGDISAKLAKAMKDANVSNNLTDNNGTYTPPVNPPSMSDIGESKTFFSSLRTQAMSVVDYKNSGTPGFLDTEAKSLGTALEGISLNTSIAGEYVALAITEILNAIDNNQTTRKKYIEDSETRSATITKSTTNASVWTYEIKDDSAVKYSGTVTMPLDIPANITPINFTTLTASFDGTVPKRKLSETSDTGIQRFVTNMTLTKTTDGADFVLSDATLSSDGQSLAISNAAISTGYSYDTTKTEDKLTTNYVKLNSLTLNGAVAGYTLSGTVAIPTYVSNSSLAGKGFMEDNYKTRLNGRIICIDNGQRTTVNDVTAIYKDKDDVNHTLSVNHGNFYAEYNGNLEHMDGSGGYSSAYNLGPNQDYSSFVGTNLDNNRISFSSTSCNNLVLEYLSVGADQNSKTYNSGNIPKVASFTGSIVNTATSASLVGTLTVDLLNAATINLIEGANDEPKFNVNYNGKLKMLSNREMVVSLGYTNPEQKNDFLFSYSYGSTVVNGTGNFDKNVKNGTIVLTNHLGLNSTIKVTNGDVVYGVASSVKKNGKLIGTLEEREGVPVIKYTDGTFESLP